MFVKRDEMRTASLKTTPIFFLSILLGVSFWIVSAPILQGDQMTPAELIQSKLPRKKTIASATEAQLLEAICKAIKQSPKEAALVVRTAAGARQSIKADILCMATRCLRQKQQSIDCRWIMDILREWIKAEPNQANRLTESVVDCVPECRDRVKRIARGEGGFGPIETELGNINVAPGSTGGGAFGSACLVCHNGQEVQVACSDLENYLRNHPGDTAGPCQPTPVTNP